MSHNTLQKYYVDAFNITVNNKAFTLTEFEEMIPYERDIYMSLLAKRNEELLKNGQE